MAYSCSFGPCPEMVNVTAIALGGLARELINHHNRWQLQLLLAVEGTITITVPKLGLFELILKQFRKRGGVKKSMGNEVPWKTGMLIYLPVTSRPLTFPQKEAVLSPCNFATTHLTACILNFIAL